MANLYIHTTSGSDRNARLKTPTARCLGWLALDPGGRCFSGPRLDEPAGLV
jgi:hypothetical protein